MEFISNEDFVKVITETYKFIGIANDELTKHRHAGTWFVLRNLYSGIIYLMIVIKQVYKYDGLIMKFNQEVLKIDSSVQFPEDKALLMVFLKGFITIYKYWIKEVNEFQIVVDFVEKFIDEQQNQV